MTFFVNLTIRFQCDGQQSKVGMKTVCQSYEDGRLGMVDVLSFLSSIKIGWLRRVFLGGYGLGDTTFKLFRYLHRLKLFGDEF